MPALVPWLVMAALVAALLGVHRSGRLGLEWLVKPVAAATFVGTAIHAGATESPFGAILLVGLVLAAVGDVLLIPKSKLTFLLGLVAFLLGHLAYAVAFYVRGLDAVAMAVAGPLMLFMALLVLTWLWPHVEKPMRGPVLAYVVVITAMVTLAAGTAGKAHGLLFLVGAVGFYLSDISVARERFVKRELRNKLWGLPLYFFAQLLLASLAGPGR